MKLPKRTIKHNYKQKLSSVLSTSGIGLFLVVGLSGCNNNNDCDKNGLYDSKDDCNKSSSSYGGGSSSNSAASHTSSGFFAPITAGAGSYHGSSGGSYHGSSGG